MPKNIRQELKLIAELVEPNSKVLDIGCSNGELLQYLKTTKNVDARGVEISQEGVSTCVKKGLSVVQGDADYDLDDYPDKSFDYVISSQMIQATKHPKEVLDQVLRIGKKSIISIPNFGHWQNRYYLLLQGMMPVTKALSYEWYETPNIHFCTIKDFAQLLKKSKAKIDAVKYLDSDGSILSGFKQTISSNIFADKAIFLVHK